MAIMQATLQFTTPGELDDSRLTLIREAFPDFLKVDTVAGWGNLDQDWYELSTEVNTSWGWCRPTLLTEKQWESLLADLTAGRILMMVHYEVKGEIVPHH